MVLRAVLASAIGLAFAVQLEADELPTFPVVETVTVKPLEKAAFHLAAQRPNSEGNGRNSSTSNKTNRCPEKRQGGNPRQLNGVLVFDGATDGNRQVDPQIAVGSNHILHGTNTGLILYDKQGNFVDGVSQGCFNGGIDPKLFFDPHNHIFGFNLWNPWDAEKKKPANIAVSTTNDPTGAWRILPVPIPAGVDGGGIGFSRSLIGYTYPGGDRQSFVLETQELLNDDVVHVHFFGPNLGQPVFTQDPIDSLYFFALDDRNFRLHCVEKTDGGLRASQVFAVPHELEYIGWPPQSPQKDSPNRTASGDRNPKNVVLQNGHLWFSHTVNCDGRAAVQWHQVDLTGQRIQTGLISSPSSSYIQTTLAVNQHNDVLVGFQETSDAMYISPRLAFRRESDPPGELRPMIPLGEGMGATEGGAWGDYSGSVVDGGNLVDLWTVQSIANASGRGETVIAKLPSLLE